MAAEALCSAELSDCIVALLLENKESCHQFSFQQRFRCFNFGDTGILAQEFV